MPNSGRRKASFGLQMQVEQRRVHVLAVGMRKVHAHMGFEGTFVGGEAGIAVDAKQGTARGTRVGHKMRS